MLNRIKDFSGYFFDFDYSFDIDYWNHYFTWGHLHLSLLSIEKTNVVMGCQSPTKFYSIIIDTSKRGVIQKENESLLNLKRNSIKKCLKMVILENVFEEAF